MIHAILACSRNFRVANFNDGRLPRMNIVDLSIRERDDHFGHLIGLEHAVSALPEHEVAALDFANDNRRPFYV